jgi:hypothetical protein
MLSTTNRIVTKVGFDYWQVLSHYPDQIKMLEWSLHTAGHDTHIISAVGRNRAGSVAKEVLKVIPDFNNPRQSPELKLAKCQELGITMFYDDRTDVVDLLNANGILAFLVPRKKRGQTDLQGERK